MMGRMMSKCGGWGVEKDAGVPWKGLWLVWTVEAKKRCQGLMDFLLRSLSYLDLR